MPARIIILEGHIHASLTASARRLQLHKLLQSLRTIRDTRQTTFQFCDTDETQKRVFNVRLLKVLGGVYVAAKWAATGMRFQRWRFQRWRFQRQQ